jgi:hypothetical protein
MVPSTLESIFPEDDPGDRDPVVAEILAREAAPAILKVHRPFSTFDTFPMDGLLGAVRKFLGISRKPRLVDARKGCIEVSILVDPQLVETLLTAARGAALASYDVVNAWMDTHVLDRAGEFLARLTREAYRRGTGPPELARLVEVQAWLHWCYRACPVTGPGEVQLAVESQWRLGGHIYAAFVRGST